MEREQKRASMVFLMSAAAFLLALHPKSLIMFFSGGPGERIPEWFSYLSLMPVGYGNFGPLLTWISALMSAVFSVIVFFTGKTKLYKWIRGFGIAAIVGSVFSLMLFGTMTVFGIAILALMIVVFVMAHRSI